MNIYKQIKQGNWPYDFAGTDSDLTDLKNQLASRWNGNEMKAIVYSDWCDIDEWSPPSVQAIEPSLG